MNTFYFLILTVTIIGFFFGTNKLAKQISFWSLFVFCTTYLGSILLNDFGLTFQIICAEWLLALFIVKNAWKAAYKHARLYVYIIVFSIVNEGFLFTVFKSGGEIDWFIAVSKSLTALQLYIILSNCDGLIQLTRNIFGSIYHSVFSRAHNFKSMEKTP